MHERDTEEIGQGIFGYGKRFKGFAIYLNTILQAPTPGYNFIQGYVNDGEKLVNPMKVDKSNSCEALIRNRDPSDALFIKVTHDRDRIQVDAGSAGKLDHCFTLDHSF